MTSLTQPGMSAVWTAASTCFAVPPEVDQPPHVKPTIASATAPAAAPQRPNVYLSCILDPFEITTDGK
jgi:hypothetical protein